MNRLSLLSVFVSAIFYSCGQSNSTGSKNDTGTNAARATHRMPAAQYSLDTSIIAILPANQSTVWLLKDAKSISLTNEELNKVDQILRTCINEHNATQDTTKPFSEFIDPKNYKRQYIPYADSKGLRRIYVNCFCISDGDFDDWKKMFVSVEDGGSCFFQLTINLTELKYEQFSVNGNG